MGLEDTYPGKVKWWIHEFVPHPPLSVLYHARVYVGDIAAAGLADDNFAFGEGLGATEEEARREAEAAVAADLIRNSKG